MLNVTILDSDLDLSGKFKLKVSFAYKDSCSKVKGKVYLICCSLTSNRDSCLKFIFLRLNDVYLVRYYTYILRFPKNQYFSVATRGCAGTTSDVTSDASDNRCGRDAAEPLGERR